MSDFEGVRGGAGSVRRPRFLREYGLAAAAHHIYTGVYIDPGVFSGTAVDHDPFPVAGVVTSSSAVPLSVVLPRSETRRAANRGRNSW